MKRKHITRALSLLMAMVMSATLLVGAMPAGKASDLTTAAQSAAVDGGAGSVGEAAEQKTYTVTYNLGNGATFSDVPDNIPSGATATLSAESHTLTVSGVPEGTMLIKAGLTLGTANTDGQEKNMPSTYYSTGSIVSDTGLVLYWVDQDGNLYSGVTEAVTRDLTLTPFWITDTDYDKMLDSACWFVYLISQAHSVIPRPEVKYGVCGVAATRQPIYRVKVDMLQMYTNGITLEKFLSYRPLTQSSAYSERMKDFAKKFYRALTNADGYTIGDALSVEDFTVEAGYTHQGWVDDQTGQATTVQDILARRLTKKSAFTARNQLNAFAPEYVIYEPGEGATGAERAVGVGIGGSHTVMNFTFLNYARKIGYAFQGYTANCDVVQVNTLNELKVPVLLPEGTVIQPGTEIVPVENDDKVTLTAVWKEQSEQTAEVTFLAVAPLKVDGAAQVTKTVSAVEPVANFAPTVTGGEVWYWYDLNTGKYHDRLQDLRGEALTLVAIPKKQGYGSLALLTFTATEGWSVWAEDPGKENWQIYWPGNAPLRSEAIPQRDPGNNAFFRGWFLQKRTGDEKLANSDEDLAMASNYRVKRGDILVATYSDEE